MLHVTFSLKWFAFEMTGVCCIICIKKERKTGLRSSFLSTVRMVDYLKISCAKL